MRSLSIKRSFWIGCLVGPSIMTTYSRQYILGANIGPTWALDIPTCMLLRNLLKPREILVMLVTPQIQLIRVVWQSEQYSC